jgi:hypothetical protein
MQQLPSDTSTGLSRHACQEKTPESVCVREIAGRVVCPVTPIAHLQQHWVDTSTHQLKIPPLFVAVTLYRDAVARRDELSNHLQERRVLQYLEDVRRLDESHLRAEGWPQPEGRTPVLCISGYEHTGGTERVFCNKVHCDLAGAG